jgi:WD40 repeat protein
VNVRDELERLRALNEGGAQARAWDVVRADYRERMPRPQRAFRWKLALVPTVTAAIMALTLTPAGATVGRVISHAVSGPPRARPLLSLPAPGKLLVSGASGTWIVSGDGKRTRVGSWREATWSPHGRYLAVASARRLAAVTQRGTVLWSLSRPGVEDPTWYPPSGFRVAYRSGSSLRVVAGDGTNDHLLATDVAPVASAWRPNHAYQLAYVHDRRVVLRDADTGRVIWTRPAGRVIKIAWSADGARLLLLARRDVRVLTGNGHTATSVNVGPADALTGGSIAPDGRAVALVRRQSVQIVRLAPGPRASASAVSTALSGSGIRTVTWSPDSRWLLASWPTADEWVFLATGPKPSLTATSRIAQQFHQPSAGRLPALEGWCCVANTTTSSRRR